MYPIIAITKTAPTTTKAIHHLEDFFSGSGGEGALLILIVAND